MLASTPRTQLAESLEDRESSSNTLPSNRQRGLGMRALSSEKCLAPEPGK